MLHTLHRSPWLTDFAALLRLLSEGDELLLLQDGVTAAVDGNRYLESLRNAPIKVYALNEDLIARGLTGQISNDIIPIDYTDFVCGGRIRLRGGAGRTGFSDGELRHGRGRCGVYRRSAVPWQIGRASCRERV